ncbi:hypothetical protein ACVI1J_010423 [Bradyrhizobium diazoefficiens]|jgi:hypothetical protein|uniref:Uncharacterized protein n=4 Tax=Bradyrhizobium TaxID=374 RepID=A0A7Z0QN86_9BRAD|nr:MULTISPECIES: hypothetical protein [Bradyrhizobium]MBR1034173.1 hypothetical protein [Bradyrhizobium liaoningense]MDI2077980.1 hypothetical protein [Bradyrhizobium sp. Mp27]MEB2679629.1 hypothetical protein [Bradyrhizobium japonicum]UEM18227.1 hypothetical protein J4G43_053630 [Bradyrhizobium barranii subsp. barranii]UGX99482.1 hypothetical protein G6321_00054475 [Bradyrhizobium barranii subsp. barranii]
MQELGNCEAPISGEHLISEAVIEILRGDGNFTASGLPWLEAGETKALAPKNLTANCLCRRHNSALSPLDAAAKIFFAGLRDCLESSEAVLPYLLSGHDVERWLLKTLKAMAVSGSLAQGRVKLPGAFERGVDIIRMLEHVDEWPEATGLYFIMPTGSQLINHTRFQLQPWYGDAQKELVGLWSNFLGLEFVMMIAAPNVLQSPGLKNWLYRPSAIDVLIGKSKRQIGLSWQDGRLHRPIQVTFEKLVTSTASKGTDS